MNTLYKVIARLLTDRLQKLLSCVISPSQSAFLPGRLLAENVLLATEMVHGYNWRNISPRGMLKVIFEKLLIRCVGNLSLQLCLLLGSLLSSLIGFTNAFPHQLSLSL